MREIGSEFWLHGTQSSILSVTKDMKIVLSGRTALDFIIRDIMESKCFESVMLPSYCCESMIEPFINNGISVYFYEVTQRGIYYRKNDCTAVLILDYFGYIDQTVNQIADEAKKNNQIVIYDSTHYLGERKISADYIFCSMRKWDYCNFAIVKKMSGEFKLQQPALVNTTYEELRNTAAALKKRYIAGEEMRKDIFLKMFEAAETNLEKDYIGYAGTLSFVDKNEIVKTRARNARYLIEAVKEMHGLMLWKTEMTEEDTPLFVPVFVKKELRDNLKVWLVKNQIYCPIHWPLSKWHKGYSDIFDVEISLICDQRYSIADIDREIEIIKRFLKEC